MKNSGPVCCYKCGQVVKVYRVERIGDEWRACHPGKCPDSPIEIKAKLVTGNVTKQSHSPAHLDLYLEGMDVDYVRPRLVGMTWKNIFIRLEESDA